MLFKVDIEKMPKRNGQVNVRTIVFLLSLALVAALFLIRPTFSPLPTSSFLPFVILAAPVIFIIAFINTDFALIILIFSMLLSPELSLGGIRGREVVLRMEDIFLFVVFFGWLAKMAVNKELGLLRVTPLNRFILLYIIIYAIATFYGSLVGHVKIQEGIFYLIKYFEYFLLYFMVSNSLKDRKQIKMFIYCIIFVVFLISLYAWFQHFSGAGRVTAPFEGGGEPNTLGGYLLLMMMVIAGLLLNIAAIKVKFFLGVVLCFAFPAFLFTLSRSSWIGFIPAYITLMFLSRKGKHTLFLLSMVLVLLFSVIFPKYVYERIEHTFSAKDEVTFMGKTFNLDKSAAARIDTVKRGFKAWAKSPIIGHGAGSAGSVFDNQYLRVMVEVGVVGFMAFFWMLSAIFINSIYVLNKLKNDNFAQGLTAGFIAGFIGLLMHAMGAATFIIVRIMEPFWFLAAIVVMLPEISASVQTEE